MARVLATPPQGWVHELHAFFMSHTARFWEINVSFQSENYRQVYSDREQAWMLSERLIESGCRIEQAEVVMLEAPDIYEFGNPAPMPAYEAGCKIVIDFQGHGSLWMAQWQSAMRGPQASADMRPQELDAIRRRLLDMETMALGIPPEMLRPHTITAGSAFAMMMGEDQRHLLVDGDWGARPTHPEFRIEARQEMEKTQAQVKAAQKALDLFLSCLTKDEQAEFKSQGTITIWNKLGVFRIEIESPSNTFRGMPPTFNVHAGDQVYCLNVGVQPCHMPTENDATHFPYYDHILAQMLLLKTDPIKFINVANKKER